MKQLTKNDTEEDPLDEQFVTSLKHIEQTYQKLTKHQQIRVEQWAKKLLTCDQTPIWKRNRNLYILLLEKLVLAGSLQPPFDRLPPDDLPNFQEAALLRTLLPKSPVKRTTIKHPIQKVQVPLGDDKDVSTPFETYRQIESHTHIQAYALVKPQLSSFRSQHAHPSPPILFPILQVELPRLHEKLTPMKQKMLKRLLHESVNSLLRILNRHEKLFGSDPQYYELFRLAAELSFPSEESELRIEESFEGNTLRLRHTFQENLQI